MIFLKTDAILTGMVQGMASLGATLVKHEEGFLFFDVKRGSEIDDNEKLKSAAHAFKEMYNVGLKIKRV